MSVIVYYYKITYETYIFYSLHLLYKETFKNKYDIFTLLRIKLATDIKYPTRVCVYTLI